MIWQSVVVGMVFFCTAGGGVVALISWTHPPLPRWLRKQKRRPVGAPGGAQFASRQLSLDFGGAP
jgi:hypothetical protein